MKQSLCLEAILIVVSPQESLAESIMRMLVRIFVTDDEANRSRRCNREKRAKDRLQSVLETHQHDGSRLFPFLVDKAISRINYRENTAAARAKSAISPHVAVKTPSLIFIKIGGVRCRSMGAAQTSSFIKSRL